MSEWGNRQDHMQMEIDKLRSELTAALTGAEEDRQELFKARAELAVWVQAVGRLSTLAPKMEIDTTDPTGMARKIQEAVSAELAAANDKIAKLEAASSKRRVAADDVSEHASCLEEQNERLRADLAAQRECHRWNIEEDDGDLLICRGQHEKHDGCDYVRYCRASERDAARAELAASAVCRAAVIEECADIVEELTMQSGMCDGVTAAKAIRALAQENDDGR